MDSARSVPGSAWSVLDAVAVVPLWVWAAGLALGISGIAVLLLGLLYFFAPSPRPPRPSEKQYLTVLADGSTSSPLPLPCWYDNHMALKAMAKQGQMAREEAYQLDRGECFMSVVVPAYNEELRLSGMLEEAVDYLEQNYGGEQKAKQQQQPSGSKHKSSHSRSASGKGSMIASNPDRRGWEVLIVSDGSTDRTVETALNFARTHRFQRHVTSKGPWNGNLQHHGDIPPGAIRVIRLEENRGKGGAVTHGMRHARGQFVVFADADGASKFTDLGKLVEDCGRKKDALGRAVSVGSRAHMVGTEAVVKRSLLRNILMRAFHLLIRTLTPSKTGRIKDTQCGFKLFSRAALPYIIPYMHSEGWIFDVEMLMLAESAEIPMGEVPIGWKEVLGSKLNVIKDSIGMAIGLASLRLGWGLGVYRRD